MKGKKMNRTKIKATKSAKQGIQLIHWSTITGTEAACSAQADAWVTVPDTDTYEFEGVEYTSPNFVTCKKCSRKYGA
jgi:hypothetical protein